MSLNDEIIAMLKQEDCTIIGFADLRCISKEARQNFDTGILIALSYTKEAMQDNKAGFPQKYYFEYMSINKRLLELATLTERLLVEKGYKALPKAQTMVVHDEDYRTVLPHKTVATLAGIGWIGKCATLVTNEVGSALRLIVVLTNAPLDCGMPVTRSKCNPTCTICADTCPGKAPLGGLWEENIDRDNFFNAHACHAAGHARAKELLGVEETICGLCISHCLFTKKGLQYE